MAFYGAAGFQQLLGFVHQARQMRSVGLHHDYVVVWRLVSDHTMHGQQTRRLFHWEAPLFIGLHVEVRNARIFFVKEKLLLLDRRLGGAHGMHLCTSADHSHWDLSVSNCTGSRSRGIAST